MKKFNLANYNRHLTDIKAASKGIPTQLASYQLNRQDLIVSNMPMVEHLARKFSTTEVASGILDITDLIQYGYIGLIKAVDRVDANILRESDNPESTLKSFISRRVKGAIRRAININRGSIKIPEHALNTLRKLEIEEDSYDPRVMTFFSQIFTSTDELQENGTPLDVADSGTKYNIDILNKYLLGVMKKYLDQPQYDVLRLSYGLDVPKMSAVDIAGFLCMNMSTAIVRVSQIKRDAIQVLMANTDPEEIVDLLDE